MLRARLPKIVLVLVLEKSRSSQRVGVIARPILCTARYRSTTPPVDQTFEDEDDDEYEDDFPGLALPKVVPGVPGIPGVPARSRSFPAFPALPAFPFCG
jgi:hypothetical protein